MTDKRIVKSLLKQLESKGANVDHFIDLINDYVSLWGVKNALLKDIKTRGVTFSDNSHSGVKMQKNNPSVKELVMVNRQMLAILKDLDINTSNAGENSDDEL